MNKIVQTHKEIVTFGAIHPDDEDVQGKIDQYGSLDIKGWKVAPHVSCFKISSKKSIDLLKQLSTTHLPILSCSGIGVPEGFLETGILPKKEKKQQQTQRIKDFHKVLEEIPTTTFIFAHGGAFETDALIEIMKKFPHTYTDISIQTPANIRKLIDHIGSERLLYGTDYPFFNHAFSIVSVLRATSKEEERKNIFYRNAHRIMGDI